MAIIFQTDFSGIGSAQALNDFDSTWVANPASAATLRGYGGENRVECFNTSTGRALFFNTTTGAIADCLVEIDLFIRTGAHEYAPAARMSETLHSCYGMRLSGGNLQLFRVVNGAYMQMGSNYALTVTAGQTHRLGVRCVGNQISGTLNGVDVIGPITDNNVASGYPGIRALNSTTAPALVDAFYVDNLGATPPDPTPPTGTVTIGTITPSTTSASVAYSYSAADQTGFEYRLNGGTSASIGASPATISGLTASTPYSIEIRAINAAGSGAWSAVANVTTEAEGPGNLPPSFDGPNIAAISGTEGIALSALDVSSRFSDAESALTFSAVGSWPDGVTVSSAGVISGTPTTAGTYSGLQVRATDAGALPADSNTFSITVAAAALPSTITVTEPLKNNTGTLLANVSGVRVAVLEAATLADVFETSGLTTSASGLLAAITDAAITTGQQYHVVIKLADGSVGITGPITAS